MPCTCTHHIEYLHTTPLHKKKLVKGGGELWRACMQHVLEARFLWSTQFDATVKKALLSLLKKGLFKIRQSQHLLKFQQLLRTKNIILPEFFESFLY